MPQRKRRVRIRRKTQLITKTDRQEMEDKIQEIVDNMEEVKRLQQENTNGMEELESIMKHLALKNFHAPTGDADFITPQGKASRKVNPLLFRDLVTDEEFMESATIAIGAAKKMLSERELASVVDETAAKPKKPVLVVTPASSK